MLQVESTIMGCICDVFRQFVFLYDEINDSPNSNLLHRLENLNEIMKCKPHPAYEAVKRHMSESCVVLWGLRESDTHLCAQNIVRGVLLGKCSAKIFDCRSMEQKCIQYEVLKALGCESLYHFKPKRHTWLIFNYVESLFNTEKNFFRELITHNTRFSVIFITHELKVAREIQTWTKSKRALVFPLDCCRWDEQHIRTYYGPNADEKIVQLSIRGGCPDVSWDAAADELQARWALAALV